MKVKPAVVLCVDNNPRRLMGSRLLLSIAGYAALPAHSGAAALRILRRRRVDLLIMDHLLPGLAGPELTAFIKELRPKVPVVLLIEGQERPPGAERTDQVLRKDTDPAELLAMIGRLVAKRESTPAVQRRQPSKQR